MKLCTAPMAIVYILLAFVLFYITKTVYRGITAKITFLLQNPTVYREITAKFNFLPRNLPFYHLALARNSPKFTAINSYYTRNCILLQNWRMQA